MKKMKSNLFYVLVASGIIFSSCGASEIKGESNESYIKMDSECGCDSPNSESKREDIFNSKYKDRWVNYIGTIEFIDDDILKINTDLSGMYDVEVKFENPKDIYNLKIGSFIAVKFVLREQGGCFSSYIGNNGKIMSTDMLEINKMMK